MALWCTNRHDTARHVTPRHWAAAQVDRLYGWKSVPDSPVRDAFKRQKEFVMTEFEQRSSQVFLQVRAGGCAGARAGRRRRRRGRKRKTLRNWSGWD